MKVARNEKRKKLLGFSFYINIGNFEAFLQNLNLSAKHLFWTCEYVSLSAWQDGGRSKGLTQNATIPSAPKLAHDPRT